MRKRVVEELRNATMISSSSKSLISYCRTRREELRNATISQFIDRFLKFELAEQEERN